jgi:hypothetical protein
MNDKLEALIAKFHEAGCTDAESWASSEINEDIAQFARFVFLRDLWKLAIRKGSREWLRELDLPNDDGQGGAKRRLKESSASIDDLTELVRAAQRHVVRNVAYLLDGYAPGGGHVEEVDWGLFELDDQGQPARAMGGLHESVDDVGSEVGG